MASEPIIQFPKRPIRRRRVRGKEVWAQPKPPDEMVWEVCPYVNGVDHCTACTEGCIPDETYGPCTPGCWMTAQEACRIVFAMQQRLAGTADAR